MKTQARIISILTVQLFQYDSLVTNLMCQYKCCTQAPVFIDGTTSTKRTHSTYMSKTYKAVIRIYERKHYIYYLATYIQTWWKNFIIVVRIYIHYSYIMSYVCKNHIAMCMRTCMYRAILLLLKILIMIKTLITTSNIHRLQLTDPITTIWLLLKCIIKIKLLRVN